MTKKFQAINPGGPGQENWNYIFADWLDFVRDGGVGY